MNKKALTLFIKLFNLSEFVLLMKPKSELNMREKES
jgi:hypothetical protein